MSHLADCPDEGEARRRARSDATFDAKYGHRRYHSPWPECEEGDSVYRREYGRAYQEQEYRAEDERQERAAQRRREEERRIEEAYHEECRQEEEARQEQEAPPEP